MKKDKNFFPYYLGGNNSVHKDNEKGGALIRKGALNTSVEMLRRKTTKTAKAPLGTWAGAEMGSDVSRCFIYS